LINSDQTKVTQTSQKRIQVIANRKFQKKWKLMVEL